MKHQHEIADWLFQRFGVDPALAGDIFEESERRRSRVWFARQVLAALCASLWMPIRDDKTLAIRTIFIALGATEAFILAVQYPWHLIETRIHWAALSAPSVISTLFFVLVTSAAAGWVVARAQTAHRAITLLAFLIVQLLAYVYYTFDWARMLVVDSIDQPRFRLYLAFSVAQLITMTAGILLGGMASPPPDRKITGTMETR